MSPQARVAGAKTQYAIAFNAFRQFPLTAQKSSLLRANEHYLLNFSQFQPPDFRYTLY